MVSCQVLKKRISSARTQKKRGKALGAYSKNCTKYGKKRKKKSTHKRKKRR